MWFGTANIQKNGDNPCRGALAIVINFSELRIMDSSVLRLARKPIENVRVGFIGLGMRGPGAVERFISLEHATVAALCDLYPGPVADSQKILADKGCAPAKEFTGPDGWKRLCELPDLDLVYVAAPWQLHAAMGIYAMECGKNVALEVPAATTVEECWALVETAERTRMHCMMLENSCYDSFEMTCLRMAREGVFGDIVHVEGGYCHNLSTYWDKYRDDWSMRFSAEHHGDVYPTHGIGPLCQLLDIHRGDKLSYLVSMDSAAIAGQAAADSRYGAGNVSFSNGDITSTLIRTTRGRSILLQHSVMTPQPYSRLYRIYGTRGFANKYPSPGFVFDEGKEYMPQEEVSALMARYKHPVWQELEEKALTIGGHNGIDYIMDYRLVECLHKGLPLDMDVYDAAEWSSIVELSEQSILGGSIPVQIPDFTRGR